MSLAGAVVDILAAYLLQQTDFSKCAYTYTELTASCESDECSHLKLPSKTCYCCYLYESRDDGGCETPLLLSKQTYFTSISSCEVIPNQLQPMLYCLGLLSLLSVLVNVVFFFMTTPIRYPGEKDADNDGNSKSSSLHKQPM